MMEGEPQMAGEPRPPPARPRSPPQAPLSPPTHQRGVDGRGLGAVGQVVAVALAAGVRGAVHAQQPALVRGAAQGGGGGGGRGRGRIRAGAGGGLAARRAGAARHQELRRGESRGALRAAESGEPRRGAAGAAWGWFWGGSEGGVRTRGRLGGRGSPREGGTRGKKKRWELGGDARPRKRQRIQGSLPAGRRAAGARREVGVRSMREGRGTAGCRRVPPEPLDFSR